MFVGIGLSIVSTLQTLAEAALMFLVTDSGDFLVTESGTFIILE